MGRIVWSTPFQLSNPVAENYQFVLVALTTDRNTQSMIAPFSRGHCATLDKRQRSTAYAVETFLALVFLTVALQHRGVSVTAEGHFLCW